MANVTVVEALDLNNLDLNRVYVGSNYGNDSNFYDDLNIIAGGTAYKDVLEVFWDYGNGSYISYFGGPSINMEYDFSIFFTDYYTISGGKVTGYLEAYYDGYEYIPYASFTDISVSAEDLYDAAKTTAVSYTHLTLPTKRIV